MDEYSYRFNRSLWKESIFDNLIQRMVKAKPLTYKALIINVRTLTVNSKNEIRPFLKEQYVIPAEQSAAFVCQMEAVLEVYERPYDSNPIIVQKTLNCRI